MKKIFFSMMLCLLTVCSSAQTYQKNIVGARLGFGTANATSMGVSASPVFSYMFGVTDQILLDEKLPFYLETGLSVTGNGYQIKGYDESNTYLTYLQIPLRLNYHINVNRSFKIIPSAGMYYAIGIGGELEYDGRNIAVFSDKSLNRSDFGGSLSLSATFGKFFIGINHDMGWINIDNKDLVYPDNKEMIGYKKLKNQSTTVQFGVNF